MSIALNFDKTVLNTSVFFRLAQMRKALLYATSTTDRTAFLCEWRYLELEMLDCQLKFGAIRFASPTLEQQQYLVLASRLMYEIRQKMASHVENEKIRSIPFAPWNADTHFKLLPVNLAFIVRLYKEISNLDQFRKPNLGQIMDWENLCTLLMRTLLPLMIIKQRFMMVQDTDDTPGRDDTFFDSVKLFPVEFEEKPQDTLDPAPSVSNRGDALNAENARVAALVAEYTSNDPPFENEEKAKVETERETQVVKKRKSKKKKRNLTKQQSQTVEPELGSPPSTFNMAEVQAYMARKWRESMDCPTDMFILQDGEVVPFDSNNPMHIA